MLYRKIQNAIAEHFRLRRDRVLLVSGARQIGKSYIIRYVANQIFKNVVEINLVDDFNGSRLFENVRTVEEFYMTVSALAGQRLGTAADTLIFLDEIQQYPHLLTMLKFLREDNRFTYAASGSLLGISLRRTTSIPIGSIAIMRMYPMDFEEFLIANNVGKDVIEYLRKCYIEKTSASESIHKIMMDNFVRYLIVGGMPQAVQEFVNSRNVAKVREIQGDIHMLYTADAAKYDEEHRLKIERIYNLIPSTMESKKKRIIYREIEDKKGKRHDDYVEEFDFLSASGIALEVKAISNPTFPLIESGKKNLLKLYLNDVGLLTRLLYRNNIKPILDTEKSVNLGSVYETVVATQLAANGNNLFYYDNKKLGEVDYLIDNYQNATVTAIEVKSGKDYTVHSSLDRFMRNEDYRVGGAIILNNSREVVKVENNVTYMPIYFTMFIDTPSCDEGDLII